MTELALSLADLPESPIEGLEPLLDNKQLAKWLQTTTDYINEMARRDDDPFPLHGSPRLRRALPSEVIAWMKRQSAANRAS